MTSLSTMHTKAGIENHRRGWLENSHSAIYSRPVQLLNSTYTGSPISFSPISPTELHRTVRFYRVIFLRSHCHVFPFSRELHRVTVRIYSISRSWGARLFKPPESNLQTPCSELATHFLSSRANGHQLTPVRNTASVMLV